MKNRILNELYAKIRGYFWIPCPSCGNYFGGHEWGDGAYSCIPKTSDGSESVGICPTCQDTWEETGKLPI